MDRLNGKMAVVTGGASGIGRACALRLAAEGAGVVVADIDEQRGAETVAEIEAAGRRAVFVRTDTSREEDCESLADAVVSALGRVDVAVAAAGISHADYVSGQSTGTARGDLSGSFLLDKPLSKWQRVLDVNLTGVMLTNRAVARRMIADGRGGSIVNIASGAARAAIPGAADYCVSKAGVWMLTKSLALELAPHGIRVNAVGPGFIATPMTESFRDNEAAAAAVIQQTPLRRFGTPDDIAAAAAYLSSDDASFVTGEILQPDGGLHAAYR